MGETPPPLPTVSQPPNLVPLSQPEASPPPPSSPMGTVTSNVSKGPSSRGWVKVVAIVVAVVLILGTSLVGTATAIAYGKLKINNPSIEQPISHFIQGLPFTPKTPKFLLESVALAHSKVSRHSFDVSLAAQSQDYVSALGLNHIDVEAKGSVDYSDTKDLQTSVNLSVTKDFNADIRKKDNYLYIKVNKVPGFLTTMLQIDPTKLSPVLENWIGFDTQPLQTEARKSLDKNNDQKSLTKEYVTQLVDDLSDEKLLSALSTSDDNVDGHSAIKMHMSTDSKTIDTLIYKIQDRLAGDAVKNQPKIRQNDIKPSDYIKDLKMDLWVDKKDYFIRKVETTFRFNPNFDTNRLPTQVLGVERDLSGETVLGADSSLYTLGRAESAIATVIKFDNFGQKFEIAAPAKFLKPEEYVKLVMATSDQYKNLGDPEELAKRSRDAARLSDLANLQQAINVAVQDSTSSSLSVLCANKTVYCSGLSNADSAKTRSADGTGWVKVNLSGQRSVSVPMLPADPLNSADYHYVYCANKDGWEINAILESSQQKSKMSTDGGDDPNRYEVGSNLQLIDKIPGCRY